MGISAVVSRGFLFSAGLVVTAGYSSVEEVVSMLDVDAAVRILALQSANLVAVIADRIFPDQAPQASQEPFLAYSMTSDTRPYNLNDEIRGHSGLAVSRIQFLTVAADRTSFARAKSAHTLLRLAISGYKGTVSNGDSPPQTLFIHGIFHAGGFSDNRDRTNTRVIESVYEVQHAEQQPGT